MFNSGHSSKLLASNLRTTIVFLCYNPFLVSIQSVKRVLYIMASKYTYAPYRPIKRSLKQHHEWSVWLGPFGTGQ